MTEIDLKITEMQLGVLLSLVHSAKMASFESPQFQETPTHILEAIERAYQNGGKKDDKNKNTYG
jgi:hypothetical protein